MEQINSLKTNQKFKKTEIGEIPVDWEVVKIKDILSLEYGKGLPENKREGDKYPVYGSNGIVGYNKEFLVKGPGIVVGRKGTIGNITWTDKDYWPIDTTYFITIDKNKTNLRWLYYQLLFLKLDQLNAATGVPGLNRNEVLNLNVSHPPLPEQKKISEVISTVDKAIEQNNEIIEKTKELKFGTMQELLIGKRRLPGFSGEWEVKKLGNVVNFRNGKAHEKNISENGKYVVVNSKFISTEGEVKKFSNSCLCPVYKKEIVMVMSDVPNGKAIAKCFYIDKDDKYTLNQRICSLKAIEVDSKFLFYQINRNPYYLTFDDGVKQTNLRKEDVLDCPLKFPLTIREQTAIAQVLSNMDAEIEQLEQKLDKYRRIKQGIMQMLLTGRKRVRI